MAAPAGSELFRKQAAYRVGDAIFQATSVHNSDWIAKVGRKGIAGETLYREEAELLRANPHREVLERAFDIARIDYGRLDFGVVDGAVQVYEINTNPNMSPPKAHPSPIRAASTAMVWRTYLDALAAIDRLPEGVPAEISLDGLFEEVSRAPKWRLRDRAARAAAKRQSGQSEGASPSASPPTAGARARGGAPRRRRNWRG